MRTVQHVLSLQPPEQLTLPFTIGELVSMDGEPSLDFGGMKEDLLETIIH